MRTSWVLAALFLLAAPAVVASSAFVVDLRQGECGTLVTQGGLPTCEVALTGTLGVDPCTFTCWIKPDLTMTGRGFPGALKSVSIYAEYVSGDFRVVTFLCERGVIIDTRGEWSCSSQGIREGKWFGLMPAPGACRPFTLGGQYNEEILVTATSIEIDLALCRDMDGVSSIQLAP